MSNTITAAAQRFVKRIVKDNTEDRSQLVTAKQEQAWSYWDDTPEVRFAGAWIGNSMGRARLFAGRRMPDGSVEPLPPEHRASELVAGIAGGPSGQSELLTEFGPHLVVAGEARIIIEYDRPAAEEWHVISTSEVRSTGNKNSLEVIVGDRRLIIPALDPESPPDPNDTSPLAVRVWNPHPRRHSQADSPIFSSFAILDELRLLNAAVAAIAKSRLTGRGILFVPQGSRFPTATGGQGEEDDFTTTLMNIATIAYGDPDSAAAAVPIVVEVPQDFAGEIQRLTFESDFDDLAVKLREETIRRFASSLDTPAEILLGTAAINHWGQWALEESAIRIAIEPKLGLVSNALTDQWMRPILEVEDNPDATTALVWYDTADLRAKTNRGQTSMELYDRDEINGNALRRENNFDDADAPSPEERRRGILLRLLFANPELAGVILPEIGIQLDGVPDTPPPSPNGDGPETPVVQLPVDEENGPPTGEDMGTEDEGLFAAVDGIVWRALERAGQRIRSRTGRASRPELQEVDAAAVHCEVSVSNDEIDQLGLLDGAWCRAPEVAARYHIAADQLEAQLDEYVRGILVNGVEHDWELARVVGQTVKLREAS